jgi:putative transposase
LVDILGGANDSKPRHKTLANLVNTCYFENRRRYGTRRIRADLQKSGVKIGCFQIQRLMKEQNLKAIQPKSFQPKTTDSKGVKVSSNLLAAIKIEECAATKIIIGDITYLSLRNDKFDSLAR